LEAVIQREDFFPTGMQMISNFFNWVGVPKAPPMLQKKIVAMIKPLPITSANF